MRRSFLKRAAAMGAVSAVGAVGGAGALTHGLAWAGFDVSTWPAGQPLPVFQAQDLDGKTWRLADLRGRAVILNFWATWCEPCRAEMPTLQQAAEIYGPDKLVVLTMNYKESAAKAAQFVRATGLTLPVLLDPTGDITRLWEVRAFPSTMLIAADGKSVVRIRGELDWSGSEAEKMIAPLLRRV